MSHIKRQKFIFLGSPQFAATILDGLLQAGWTPALVITEPPKPVGRKQVLTPTAVQIFAKERSLPIATPVDRTALLESLRSIEPFDLLVVAAYGRILTQEMLDLPGSGAINVHASLLPKYRGASPIQAALLSGDVETGVTFMQMEAGLDTGPMLDSVSIPLEPTETTQSLTVKLALAAAQALPDVLQRYVSGEITSVTQPADGVSLAPKLTKEDGLVALGTINPARLDRMVRALSPWPGVVTNEFGASLKILSGYLDEIPLIPPLQKGEDITNNPLLLQRRVGEDFRQRSKVKGQMSYVIAQLQWAGKVPTDGATFARANRDILTKLPPSIKLGANVITLS